MDIKKSISIRIALAIILLILFDAKIFCDTPDSQLRQMVVSIQGLGNDEIELLSQSLLTYFEPLSQNQSITPEILESIKSVVSAGIFEEASYNNIGDVAYKVYQAEMNNAPAEYVEDLALIGFSHHIAADQLEFAAKSLGELIDHDVDPVVIEEIISYGIYNNWSGKAIAAVSDGIIQGVDKNLNSRKLALAFIISVDQNVDNREVAAIVDENIEYIEKIDSQPHMEPESEKVAYTFLQRAISQNIPRRISEELYFISLRDKWSAELITAVFEGVIKGHEQGLSPEKLATSIIVRVAQNATEINPQKLVREEIKYVHQAERKKVELLRKDQRKFKRQPEPVQQRDDSYISTGSQTTEIDDKHVTYYRQADRNRLNNELMEQRIRDFLGPPATPYRWGGTSVRGVDCSGFVQAVYFSQGIYLPRTSRRQVYIGHQVSVSELKFGDLLFFSKYFNNYITHVGIYLGNGRFVHASCSKGVVISSLANNYYRHRFRVAKRVVG